MRVWGAACCQSEVSVTGCRAHAYMHARMLRVANAVGVRVDDIRLHLRAHLDGWHLGVEMRS